MTGTEKNGRIDDPGNMDGYFDHPVLFSVVYIYIGELAQGSFDTIVSQNGRMIVWINIKGNENVGSVLI